MKEFIAEKPPQVRRPDHTAADILAELRKHTKMMIHMRSHITVMAWCTFLAFIVAEPLMILIAWTLVNVYLTLPVAPR